MAVLLVLAAHVGAPGFSGGGEVGVTSFFVLSGYLITGVLLESEDLRTFYVRRAARLLPGVALLLLTITAVAVASQRWNVVSAGVISSAAYVSNIVLAGGTTLGPLDHMWSLATEEQFYFLWPGLIAFAPRGWLAPIAVAGIVIATTLRLLGGTSDAALWSVFHMPLTRMDALLIGAVVRIVPLSRPSLLLTSVATAVLAMMTVGVDYTVTIPYLMLPIAAAAAVVLVRRPRLLLLSPLRWVGDISYALYLWHFPLIYVAGPVGALIAVPIAWVSTRYIEEPIRRWARMVTPLHPDSRGAATLAAGEVR